MNIKILVVDEELNSVSFIQKALEVFGFDLIKYAETTEDALRPVKSLQPELILTDTIQGGDIDGMEAPEKNHKITDIPIIFITVSADVNSIQRSKKVSPYGYLIKPSDSLQLLFMVVITLSSAGTKRSPDKAKNSTAQLFTALVIV
ncbi:MAG: response regulator [Ignavibacteriaceae bacterium]